MQKLYKEFQKLDEQEKNRKRYAMIQNLNSITKLG